MVDGIRKYLNSIETEAAFHTDDTFQPVFFVQNKKRWFRSMKPLWFAVFTPPPKGASEHVHTELFFHYADPNSGMQDIERGPLRVDFIFTMTTIREYLHTGKPTFLTTANMKIAVKVIDNVYWLLGAEHTIPESSIANSLQLILDYFHFYHSSLHDIRQACNGDENAFKYQIQEICTRMLSILFFIYPDTVTQQFLPIPYCPLPMV